MDETAEKTQEIKEQQTQPLLENDSNSNPNPTKQPQTRTQKSIRKTIKRTSQLSSLLPTGSVLIFEMCSPIVTKQGRCDTILAQIATFGLVIFIGLTCIILCFIDSVRDERGKIRYGLATFKGIIILDGSMSLDPEEAAKYRIKCLDFLHAFMGVLIFAALVVLNQNVVKCLFPRVSESVLVTFPIVVGVVSGLLFMWFPNTRNGVVDPVSKK